MLGFCQKVLQPAFDQIWHQLFEDEVNRLFRTNEFNVPAHLQALKVHQITYIVAQIRRET